MNRKFLISGPSGAGKTTIVNELTQNRVVTTTSRSPRKNEKEGKDYYFVTKNDFLNKINNNEMLEYAEYNGNYYGLTKMEFQKRLEQGDVFIVCETKGKRTFKKLFPDAISIFIYADLKDVERQLEKRGGKEEEIRKRVDLFHEDMQYMKEYDIKVKNKYGKLKSTIRKIKIKIFIYQLKIQIQDWLKTNIVFMKTTFTKK